MGKTKPFLLKRKTKKQSRPGKKKSGDVFNQLIALTGIPAASIKRELQGILERKNLDIHHLTVDQLRGVVATYLRQIMGNVLDRYSGRHH